MTVILLGCFPIQNRPVFSQFLEIFLQPEDSKIQKAQAISKKKEIKSLFD